VPLQCQGEPAEVRERLQRTGSSAMLAFDGERCVAQLQFRPYEADTRSPDGVHNPLYWMDYPAGFSAVAPSLSLFCFHVGQTESAPEQRDPRYLGRGIGTALLRHAIDWAGSHGYHSVIAKGLAPCWPVIQYMGGMPWPVYEAQGFSEVLRYHDEGLREVLDEILLGAYGARRLSELTAAVEEGADLDALAEVRIFLRPAAGSPQTSGG
jgi:GNAT superfamily N-acetyltransferase